MGISGALPERVPPGHEELAGRGDDGHALWDINGKALGVPVCGLVGGKVRERAPLYANGWFSGNHPSAHGPQAGSASEAAWYGAPPAGSGWGTDIDDAIWAKYPPSSFMPVESEPYMGF